MGQQSLEQKAADAAWEFFHQKEEFDQSQKEFDEHKKTFYKIMDEYFAKIISGHINNGCSSKSVKFNNDGFAGGQLVVKKVEKTSIEWDAEKLERKVEKSVAKQIIKKQYRISDMRGLIGYLKGCGVDPVIFKQFLVIDKTVDEKAIDRLGDTGQLSVNQINGCYTVKTQKPYFTTQVKKDDRDGEQ